MRLNELITISLVALIALAAFLLPALRSDPGTAEAATTTTTIRWGPYTVPAASGGTPGQTHNGIDGNVEKPCTDCFVTSVVPNLIDEDGSTINFTTGGMLHHMVLFDTNGTDATCGSSGVGAIGERILASGNERTILSLPDGYGYYIGPGNTESWLVLHDIMNMTMAERDVYLEFEFTYRPGTDDVNPVTPVWLDQDNCADSEFSVPAGYSDSHWDWTATAEGDVVSIGGHVHDWGISISAEDVTQNEFVCASTAGYPSTPNWAPAGPGAGTAGHPASHNIMTSDPIGIETYRMGGIGRISDMSGCAPFFRVHAGDVIRLHTQYSTSASANDVMGIMVGYVHVTTGPTPTPAGPRPTDTATPPATSTGTATPSPTVTPTPTITPTQQPDPGDTDGDGCSDARESGSDEKLGGLRDYMNPNDFYDTDGDQYVNLTNDILGVVFRWSPNPSLPYDPAYDRGPVVGPYPWSRSAPDGSINLIDDILGVILQWQHDCR